MDRWTWHICQCVCCCWSLQVYRYRSDKPTTQATSALKLEVPQFELFHSHLLQRKVESFGLIYSLQVRPSPSVLPTLPWQCYVSCTVHISCQYKRLGKQIWLFRWFAFYEAVISSPWISDDQILSALLDMYVWHWTICPWTESGTGLYVVLYPESTQVSKIQRT